MGESKEQTDGQKLDEWDVLNILDYPETDIGTSKLFADVYKRKLKFVRELGLYFFYNGTVWVKDVNFVYARRLAKKFAIDAVKYANQISEEKIRETAVKYYAKFNGYNQREKLIKDAQSVYVIDYGDFDTHPRLYNCKNGTFNLDTGELQEHNPEDMLTQVSNVEYHAGAVCERWEKYIDEVMDGDEQSKNLLQMIAGYCLAGDTKFECFFILYGGTTRNGKGTFNSTMFKMHKDYAKVIQPESLSVKSFYNSSDAPNESIASLAGSRYVCVSEPGEDLFLNSDLVKTLTGGDPIKARFLRQNSFTYTPQFKIVINTNFLPKVKDDTIFTSDRLYLLNFEKHFGLEIRDSRLKEKLIKPENMSGIFNWCYEGYKMLEIAGRFHLPDKSKKLFEQYRAESDTTQQFINECLVKLEGERTPLTQVYNRYRDWAADNGFAKCNKATLRKRLERKFLIDEYNHQLRIFDYALRKDEF